MRQYLNDNPRSINKTLTLIDALKMMDSTDVKSLLIVEDNHMFVGVLSIGDIQRAIINNLPLETAVFDILRKNPRIANENTSIDTIKEEMIQHRMEFMPVVDDRNQISGLYLWEDFFQSIKLPPLQQFNLPVVIMAGGIGTRLKPLTNILPKPLIPVGEKTILEEIFHRFGIHGCNHFLISVNYKAELIEYYLKMLELPYKLEFFKEEKPLGTAGSLTLIRDSIDCTFIVSNCDILIEEDYSEILNYHRENKNEITIVAAMKQLPFAYGTLETGYNGKLIKLEEKPELTVKINSGMYFLEPKLLEEIPENQFYHITHLIKKVLNRGGKVGVFPISEKSWKDIGNWDDLRKLW